MTDTVKRVRRVFIRGILDSKVLQDATRKEPQDSHGSESQPPAIMSVVQTRLALSFDWEFSSQTLMSTPPQEAMTLGIETVAAEEQKFKETKGKFDNLITWVSAHADLMCMQEPKDLGDADSLRDKFVVERSSSG